MPTYKVVTPIKHDGKTYRPADAIDLTREQAKAMPWAVLEDKTARLEKAVKGEKPKAGEKEKEKAKPPKEPEGSKK